MKRNIPLTLVTALVMLGLPLLAVTFFKGDSGMAICFLLFFAIDPIYAIAVGMFAGRDRKRCWFQPLLTALLFLAGTWLVFDPGEVEFLLYAGVYLLLGLSAMGLTLLLHKQKKSCR